MFVCVHLLQSSVCVCMRLFSVSDYVCVDLCVHFKIPSVHLLYHEEQKNFVSGPEERRP